ncbi:MAG: ribonuclease Z [Chloroflexi bacterium]|nr:ribonuclease Z [Chloroflexota bacterium]
MLELTFLGSGNAFASSRYWSSFLANGRYLFDAPPTALPHLKRAGCPLADLRVVFISHFHADHFLGLPFLFLEYVYLTPRRDDLHIVGPPGVERFTEELADRCYPDLSRAEAGYRRRYTEADPTGPQTIDEISFRAVPMQHAGGKLDCFGYRVTIDGVTVAYTGDAEYSERIFDLAEGANVLVVDCTYDEAGPEHMGLDDVRQVRKRVDPATTVILTHLDGDPDVTGLDNVIVAQDFATYQFR